MNWAEVCYATLYTKFSCRNGDETSAIALPISTALPSGSVCCSSEMSKNHPSASLSPASELLGNYSEKFPPSNMSYVFMFRKFKACNWQVQSVRVQPPVTNSGLRKFIMGKSIEVIENSSWWVRARWVHVSTPSSFLIPRVLGRSRRFSHKTNSSDETEFDLGPKWP